MHHKEQPKDGKIKWDTIISYNHVTKACATCLKKYRIVLNILRLIRDRRVVIHNLTGSFS